MIDEHNIIVVISFKCPKLLKNAIRNKKMGNDIRKYKKYTYKFLTFMPLLLYLSTTTLHVTALLKLLFV